VDSLQVGDPSQIGPFRLLGRLGDGGMGRVFLGQSPGGRKVAIKVVHPHYASDPEFRSRFAREVAAARQVGGFHTAAVVGADPEADPPWMATAYIPGPSLAEAIAQRGPLMRQGCASSGRRSPKAWPRSTTAALSTGTSSPATSSWPTTGRGPGPGAVTDGLADQEGPAGLSVSLTVFLAGPFMGPGLGYLR